jgi:hypothetical protein
LEFSSTDLIEYPVEDVFRAHRDALVELAKYLPSIESIEMQSREEDKSGNTRIVNLWTASRHEVPKLARGFIKPHMLKWIDRALWLAGDTRCEYEIELGFLKEAIRVTGQNIMEATPEGHTTVTIVGQIEVDGTQIPGVPKFMSKKIGRAVEGFVVKMITPNLKKTNDGVRLYLSEKLSQ